VRRWPVGRVWPRLGAFGTAVPCPGYCRAGESPAAHRHEVSRLPVCWAGSHLVVGAKRMIGMFGRSGCSHSVPHDAFPLRSCLEGGVPQQFALLSFDEIRWGDGRIPGTCRDSRRAVRFLLAQLLVPIRPQTPRSVYRLDAADAGDAGTQRGQTLLGLRFHERGRRRCRDKSREAERDGAEPRSGCGAIHLSSRRAAGSSDTCAWFLGGLQVEKSIENEAAGLSRDAQLAGRSRSAAFQMVLVAGFSMSQPRVGAPRSMMSIDHPALRCSR